jgi:putative spermidine/putrescine transport system ATP-binding protein
VGTSNAFDGAAATALAGREGTFAIRPERLSLRPVADGASAAGVVREVVYLGAATHTVVELDAGPVFTVSEPNTGGDRLAHRGDRVQVWWQPDHLVSLAPPVSEGGAIPARPVTLQEER